MLSQVLSNIQYQVIKDRWHRCLRDKNLKTKLTSEKKNLRFDLLVENSKFTNLKFFIEKMVFFEQTYSNLEFIKYKLKTENFQWK
jgi:hypothetical protein